MKRIALICALLAGPALAENVADAPGARLRVLDKLTGEVRDLTLSVGQSEGMGRLTVLVDACRYPADNSTAEAYGHLTIMDAASKDPVFAGWMVASSPALSALDHPRYDVWVLRCDVPDLVLPEVDETPPEEPPVDGDAAEGDGG